METLVEFTIDVVYMIVLACSVPFILSWIILVFIFLAVAVEKVKKLINANKC